MNEKFDQEEKSEIINSFDKEGWAAIHYAANLGNIDALIGLIDSGVCEINNQSEKDGWTALLLSINKNHQEFAKYLLKNKEIKINQITERGTGLHESLISKKRRHFIN